MAGAYGGLSASFVMGGTKKRRCVAELSGKGEPERAAAGSVGGSTQ